MWLALLPGMKLRHALISAFLAGLALGCARPRTAGGPEPEERFVRPPEVSAEAWRHATAAFLHATELGLTRGTVLTLIDYTLPSTSRRLWVVQLGTGQVLMHEFVAHGAGSGGTWAGSFSNRKGSKQSSVGTFVTGGTYVGVRGLSRRLHGLETGINDRARERGIVVHGTPNLSLSLGRMGRTEGCPAVPRESARTLVGLMGEGSVVFVWYPDRTLLATSEFIDQGAAALRLPGLQ
jgi:hypothetical protein